MLRQNFARDKQAGPPRELRVIREKITLTHNRENDLASGARNFVGRGKVTRWKKHQPGNLFLLKNGADSSKQYLGGSLQLLQGQGLFDCRNLSSYPRLELYSMRKSRIVLQKLLSHDKMV